MLIVQTWRRFIPRRHSSRIATPAHTKSHAFGARGRLLSQAGERRSVVQVPSRSSLAYDVDPNVRYDGAVRVGAVAVSLGRLGAPRPPGPARLREAQVPCETPRCRESIASGDT